MINIQTNTTVSVFEFKVWGGEIKMQFRPGEIVYMKFHTSPPLRIITADFNENLYILNNGHIIDGSLLCRTPYSSQMTLNSIWRWLKITQNVKNI